MDNRFEQQPQRFPTASTEPTATQPLKYTSWLLVELERLLREMPAEDRHECLQEVEEHLTCCKLALEEIGIDPSESDHEAVRRFGDPETFATQALDSHKPARRDARVMARVTAGVTIFAMVWLILGVFNMVLVWPLLILSCAIVVGYSWKFRFQLAGILKGGILATLCLSLYIGVAYIRLGDYGGLGITTRWQVPSIKADSERIVALTDQALAQCDPIQMAFRKGEGSVKQTAFYSGASYPAFEGSVPGISDAPLYKIVHVNDFKQAADSWENYKNNFQGNWSRDGMDAVSDSIAADHAGDSLFSPAMAVQGAQAGLLVTFFALCLNFVTHVIHLCSDRQRTSRRSRLA